MIQINLNCNTLLRENQNQVILEKEAWDHLKSQSPKWLSGPSDFSLVLDLCTEYKMSQSSTKSIVTLSSTF